jgi:hypothetical protein
MDIPWLVPGAVIGVGLVLVVGLIAAMTRWRRLSSPPATGPEQAPADDLPGFLESPPGSGPVVDEAGWAPLVAPPVAEHAPPPRWGRRDTVVVLLAMAVTGLLLAGLLGALALTSRDGDPRERTAGAGPATTARLTFGGIVLEPRAVGVTAAYPVVDISADGDRSRASVRFPAFNCLTADAPADPVAAGCTPAVTEYARLASPDLRVDGHGNGVVVTGRFPTEIRPNGSPPVPTGRVYELRISATPAGPPAHDGWRPARGELELGPDRAGTVDRPGISVLRSGS